MHVTWSPSSGDDISEAGSGVAVLSAASAACARIGNRIFSLTSRAMVALEERKCLRSLTAAIATPKALLTCSVLASMGRSEDAS